MKTLWIVLGVVAVLCCGGVLFLGGRIFTGAKETVESAIAYGDESLLSVAASWEPSELKSRMAPEVFAQNPENAIDDVAAILKEQLGPIKPGTIKSRILGIEAKTDSNAGSFKLTQYAAEADFEKGAGAIEMELIHRDGQWKILRFNGKKK